MVCFLSDMEIFQANIHSIFPYKNNYNYKSIAGNKHKMKKKIVLILKASWLVFENYMPTNNVMCQSTLFFWALTALNNINILVMIIKYR